MGWKRDLLNRVQNASIRIGFLKKKLRHPKRYRLLKKNKQFKDSHLGQRCFILGNGPSLKDVRFADLRSEFVFTVNQLMRRPDFPELDSNMHFWADEMFFTSAIETDGGQELIQVMRKINESNAKCFYPISQYNFVMKHGLYEEGKTFFHEFGIHMYPGYKGKIDYTKIVPGLGTVVQWCVTMAIYMGFKEIYLLGVDNTALLSIYNQFLDKDSEILYSYNVSENEKRRMAKMFEEASLLRLTRSFALNLSDYLSLADYCNRHGIQLYNCTERSLIEGVAKKHLSDVLRK